MAHNHSSGHGDVADSIRELGPARADMWQRFTKVVLLVTLVVGVPLGVMLLCFAFPRR